MISGRSYFRRAGAASIILLPFLVNPTLAADANSPSADTAPVEEIIVISKKPSEAITMVSAQSAAAGMSRSRSAIC